VLLLVYFMVEGISKVIFGLTIRPLPNWGWVFGSGVVGLLLALYLFANISSVSEWALICAALGIVWPGMKPGQTGEPQSVSFSGGLASYVPSPCRWSR
jgi:hypothetical protein